MTSPSESAIRVFLLDDHEVVRRGLTELLSADQGFLVVGEAGTVAEAIRRIPAARPEVAILDARLPDGSGIEACRELRAGQPELRCLMLTSYDDQATMRAAALAGATGYVLKEARGAVLIEAIRQVAAGHNLLEQGGRSSVTARIRQAGERARSLPTLTERERAILDYLTQGLTNRGIGEVMFMSEKTVANNISGLLAKLGVQSRTQAAVLGLQARDEG